MATNITITDRFLYSLINSYTINDKPFYGSNDYLAKQLGKSKSVISHSISRLLKANFLENRGNKFVRALYTKDDLLAANVLVESADNSIRSADNSIRSADNSIRSADNSIRSADNSISLEVLKGELAKISTSKMLKSAIESADNSYILISILLSCTIKYKKEIKKKEINENLDLPERVIKYPNLESLVLDSFAEKEKSYFLENTPEVNLSLLIEKIKNYEAQKGKQIYKDYMAALRNWALNEQEKINQTRGNNGSRNQGYSTQKLVAAANKYHPSNFKN